MIDAVVSKALPLIAKVLNQDNDPILGETTVFGDSLWIDVKVTVDEKVYTLRLVPTGIFHE
jgi:hypothetical protein